jgi:hypothetical protein
MASVFQTDGKGTASLVICFLLEMLVACGGTPSPPSTPRCDPTRASEVISVTVQNTASEILHHYPVAISLDETVLDFGLPSNDGSDLAVWDATSDQPVPAWLESYDPVAGKALLWVNLHELAPLASRKLLLTAGHVAGCSASALDGYSVFPFFSDVHDVSGWQTTNLSVTDTIPEGPLSIGGRTVIQSDGMYNGFPGIAQASNGDFVLAYKKGPGHVNSPLVVLRRSSDAGTTWSPEVVYFDSSQPDPASFGHHSETC